MPAIPKHPPGTFCWPELATRDGEAAKSFYTKLFGWTFKDEPIGDGAVYTMFEKDGRAVGASHVMRPQDHPPGTPPHWFSYLATDNADEMATRAKSLGGNVLVEPSDVMDAGRMAVIADPLGAPFGVWQAKNHPGAGVIGEAGALTWTQLNAHDPAKSAPFYAGLFGWSHRADPMPQGGEYVRFFAGGEPRAGGMPMPPGTQAPAHWLVYFGADDVDAVAARAKELGGSWFVPPSDIPGAGRFAVLADPQGAAFAVVKFAM